MGWALDNIIAEVMTKLERVYRNHMEDWGDPESVYDEFVRRITIAANDKKEELLEEYYDEEE